MSEYVFKLPDLGEGTVEAEIVEWHVVPGDEVEEGDAIADVMTDKANIEVPAPVSGIVLRTTGKPGDLVAVGAELIALEIADKPGARPRATGGQTKPPTPPSPQPSPATEHARPSENRDAGHAQPAVDQQPPIAETSIAQQPLGAEPSAAVHESRRQVITSPAIRRRAKEAGIDIRSVRGSGPRGRILQQDLDAALAGNAPEQARVVPTSVAENQREDHEVVPVIGVRRVIAARMSQSKQEIPHFAYVEEVDVTELEARRAECIAREGRKITLLAFVALALIRALNRFPQCNCRYDAQGGALHRYHAVHLGLATHTSDGLKVPVIKYAQRLGLWALADAIAQAAEAARSGSAKPQQLTGSTITLTSLGALGGIVSTPIINYPEVSIIGVNKAVPRPAVHNGQVQIRTLMNLSSCFDHRFVDGFDAASMIADVKAQLENPDALLSEGAHSTASTGTSSQTD